MMSSDRQNLVPSVFNLFILLFRFWRSGKDSLNLYCEIWCVDGVDEKENVLLVFSFLSS